MGKLALMLACVAAALATLPSGMFVGMGLAGLSVTLGVIAYRRRADNPWSRLMGAMGLTVGLVALLIATGRFAATWWAVDQLTQMLAGG